RPVHYLERIAPDRHGAALDHHGNGGGLERVVRAAACRVAARMDGPCSVRALPAGHAAGIRAPYAQAPALTGAAYIPAMASLASFDISTGAELQEVDNAVNQATKEVAQRYDFKGSKAAISFDRVAAALTLVADDDFKMKALFDVLQGKLIKRGVPVKNLELGTVTPAANDTVRRESKLTQGIPQEKAKATVKR